MKSRLSKDHILNCIFESFESKQNLFKLKKIEFVLF